MIKVFLKNKKVSNLKTINWEIWIAWYKTLNASSGVPSLFQFVVMKKEVKNISIV